MKYVEEFWNTHAGKDVWVLGCGYSLDDFPDDFFDDKISIAVNWSLIGFPNCTYYWSMHTREPTWVKKNRPETLRKYIIGYTADELFNKSHSWSMPGQWGDDVFCYAQVIPGGRTKDLDQVKARVDSILAGKHTEFIDVGTSVHPATCAAITFGAKRIYFAGCEARTFATHDHALKRGMDKFYGPDAKQYSAAMQAGDSRWFALCRLGLEWLARALEGKVEFIKYYYGKGEEVIK